VTWLPAPGAHCSQRFNPLSSPPLCFDYISVARSQSDLLAIEVLYFLAPNVKRRFRATLPGGVFAVACWIKLSSLLEEYFWHFGRFNKRYGSLGAAIALMVWLYLTGFAILLGTALNAELAGISYSARLRLR
jgi:YihY family inner membrane protein